MTSGPIAPLNRLLASLCAALLFSAVAPSAQADDTGYQPPSYQPPSYTPPTYTPPVYQPPVYQPPTYQPPTYTPPTYKPPKFEQPKIVHKKIHLHYKTVEPEDKFRYRNHYVPVPVFQERVVERVIEKPVIVEKPVYVEKPVKVTKYWVKEVHYGRCINSYEADVHVTASHASELIGRVPPGVKLHIKQCLTDKAGNWKWCSFDVRADLEGWVPAKHLEVCQGY